MYRVAFSLLENAQDAEDAVQETLLKLYRGERVLKGIGMGRDEKAIKAVRQYQFNPAMENGKPVAVEMDVEVTFHIY